MKVCSNYIYARQSDFSTPVAKNNAAENITAKNVSFGAILKDSNGVIFDSFTNRDPQTLDQVTEYLQKTFHQGGDCVFYGDPFGYEAQGILFRLPDNSNFKMTSFEFTKDAYNLRQRGIYPVFEDYNQYLLSADYALSPNEKLLRKKYIEYFDIKPAPIEAGPKYSLYLKPKKEIPKIDYMPPQLSDIKDMQYFSPDNAKCLFFRNSFFNIHKKQLMKILQDEQPLNELTFSKFIPNQAEFNETINSFKQIAKNANKKLDMNGLFVLGDIPQDHMFISPNNIKTLETSKLKDFTYIKDFLNTMSLSEANNIFKNKAENLNILRQSPLEQILIENGFEKFGHSYIRDSKQIVTTIFRKVRNI